MEHTNESILSKEILEDQKKNRIDHMTYLPGMEDIGSEILDQVVAEMDAYDYDQYTAADVKRALAHSQRTPEDFQALLSPAALPYLEEIAQAAQVETRKHFGNSVYGGAASAAEYHLDAGGGVGSRGAERACQRPGTGGDRSEIRGVSCQGRGADS